VGFTKLYLLLARFAPGRIVYCISPEYISMIFFQKFLNFRIKCSKVPDIVREQTECKGIVNGTLPVNDNIPESFHTMNFIVHCFADNFILVLLPI
jgi:hypothetical protein